MKALNVFDIAESEEKTLLAAKSGRNAAFATRLILSTTYASGQATLTSST